jgi:hypothetical protein
MQRLLLFVLAVYAFPVLSSAQGARSQLNGTVADSTGAVIVGAPVVATALETQVKSRTTTTDAGVYVIPYLPPGRYTVEVTAPGFRPVISEPVTLRVGQTMTLDFKLEVDTIAELVYIKATAPAIETSTSEIGRYVSNKEFETWPVPVGDGQRQIQAFIFSSLPGAVGGEFQGSINGGGTTRTRFSSKGCRSAAICREAAATRCRRPPRWSRSSSCRPAPSAPSTVGVRRP